MNIAPTKTAALTTVNLAPRIGAEIIVGKEALLSGVHAGAIRETLEQRGVVIIRNLGLTKDEQRVVAHTLGKVQPQGDDGIYPITLDPKIGGFAAEYLKGSFYWHIDGASDDVPNFAAILTARQLSPTGGETEFANTYAAWDDLPESEKTAIEKLKVIHSMETSQRYVNPTPTVAELAIWQRRKPKTHPLVWTHKSGRKSLVLGCTASHVEGMSLEEGRMLLCRLTEWATQPQFVYQHRWAIGDMLLWDNTGTMHRVTPYDPDCGPPAVPHHARRRGRAGVTPGQPHIAPRCRPTSTHARLTRPTAGRFRGALETEQAFRIGSRQARGSGATRR